MKRVALIVAGGKGIRMNSKIPKQFLLIKNKPVLIHTLKKFSHLDEIILVLPKNQVIYWQKMCKKYSFTLPHTIIFGGKTRFHSVKNGLEKVEDGSIVVIHDGVRPCISKILIDNIISHTKNGIGVISIIPVKDSIRKIINNKTSSIERDHLHKVQTPQSFMSDDIKEAYTQKYSNIFNDDAAVFETNGGNIYTVIGEEKNIKITTKEDLKISELFI